MVKSPEFEADIKECVSHINSGNVILYPTDTIWGLGCDALNPGAIHKIFEAKQRPKEKSLIILLADARDILQYVAAPPPDIIAIIEEFQRPTTLIFNNAINLPDNLVNEDGSIAIRVTTDPFCKALIKRIKKPLVSTSANISGQPSPATFSMVSSEIKNAVQYIVHYRQDDNNLAAPSRIARISDDGSLDIIRQ